MPITSNVSRVDIGYVESRDVRLDMAIEIRPNGDAELILYICDHSSRRTGEIISLGYYGATELRQLFNHAESTVQQLIAMRQISGLARDR